MGQFPAQKFRIPKYTKAETVCEQVETISDNFRHKCRHSLQWPLRYFSTVILSLAVLLGQVLPMQADHSNAGWMEICGGEDGSYFVQLADGSGGQGQECTHCSACMLAGSSPASTPPKIAGLTLEPKLIELPLATHPAPVTSHPEQFWSACRGPPLEGTEKSMINHGSLCDSVSQSRPGKPELRINGGLPWS